MPTPPMPLEIGDEMRRMWQLFDRVRDHRDAHGRYLIRMFVSLPSRTVCITFVMQSMSTL